MFFLKKKAKEDKTGTVWTDYKTAMSDMLRRQMITGEWLKKANEDIASKEMLSKAASSHDEEMIKAYYARRDITKVTLREVIGYPYTKEEAESFGPVHSAIEMQRHEMLALSLILIQTDFAYIYLAEKYGIDALREPNDIDLSSVAPYAMEMPVYDFVLNKKTKDGLFVMKAYNWGMDMVFNPGAPFEKEKKMIEADVDSFNKTHGYRMPLDVNEAITAYKKEHMLIHLDELEKRDMDKIKDGLDKLTVEK